MSMHLEFEPHSWYMGFAIKKAVEPSNHTRILWEGFIDNGNTYQIDTEAAYTLELLKKRIREYHLQKHTGYGELAELWKLHEYIEAGDVELLEAAGVPEELK